MAIGTAALILILSVYNGFSSMIEDNLSALDPDILLCTQGGNFFTPDLETLETLDNDPRIRSFNCILEDNVFFTYDGQQGVCRARGVDYGYELQSRVTDLVVEGDFALWHGDLPQAGVSADLAYQNHIHPRFNDALELYYPDASRPLSMMDPASSLNSAKAWPSALVNCNRDMLILPLDVMQELIGNSELLSGIEIRLVDNSPRGVRSFLRKSGLPSSYILKDRYLQNPEVFKMIKYEKFAIYMILIFVIIIIAFNIFGSLSMLMIEKEEDMESLRAMGATERQISQIFLLEGWLVSLLGMAAGMAAGLALTWLQQSSGLITVPGTYPALPYPVIIRFQDILLTFLGVGTIGFMTAFFKSRYGRR